MRVIAGTARSLKLVTPKGMDVRPTTDRIKETLFNIINLRLYDSSFLDMFAGSGAIGIEALSRGAKEAYFVENSTESLKAIEENLKHTKLYDNAHIVKSDCVSAVSMLSRQGRKFDTIFLDPPYNHELEKKVLEEIAKSDILSTEGIIIVEASADTDFSYAADLGFNIYREKSYGSNKHVFLEKQEE